MKEKIYKYLAQKGASVSSQEIISHFFRTGSEYPAHMEKIVHSMLNQDGRFVRDEAGMWSVKSQRQDVSLAEMSYVVYDFEYVTLNKIVVPLLFGYVRIDQSKIAQQSICAIQPPLDLNENLLRAISASPLLEGVSRRFEQEVPSVLHDLHSSKASVCLSQRVENDFKFRLNYHSGIEHEFESIHLKNAIRKWNPDVKSTTLETIAEHFQITIPVPLTLPSRLTLMHEIMSTLFDALQTNGLRTLQQLEDFIQEKEILVDFSGYNFDRDYLRSLPDSPGVYLMKDKSDTVIYVGKSKSLKSRVGSYFIQRQRNDEKTALIQSSIFDLVYEPTGSELEALLLENKYIHQFGPKINTQLEVHSSGAQPVASGRLVLLLPAAIEPHIVLYFVAGSKAAQSLEIDRFHPDWGMIESRLVWLSQPVESSESELTVEQIEIIWRWFSAHAVSVNHIDVDRIGSVNHCLEILARYFADDSIFNEKSIYL
ncbi:MAG: nucleotide excision repair endonuclease [Candidatus Zhuqueibacterota bacterium]